MQTRGWIADGRESKPHAGGQGDVEILRFRLPRDVWRRRLGLA
jgi:hypothetical protein